MASNLVIKLADVSSDIESLALLLFELDKIHHNAAPDRFPLSSLEKRKEDIRKIIDEGYIFYAESESQIVGFASILKKGDALVLEHLFVKPEFRFKKVATSIVQDVFSRFPEKNIFTTAYAFNHEAIKFYESLFELSSLVYKKPKSNTSSL